ncbi:MAG TPA: nitroreductase [Polyangiaceae bacterium]|nr:nitroreductase [Polyangiaceae bacterium]
MDVVESLARRRSVRAFRSDEIPEETLRRIFEEAQRAPSWCNIQPWRAWVASGETRARLTEGLVTEAKTGAPHPDIPFPIEYPEPYGARRKECGGALYRAMGIERGDTAGRQAAWLRNFVAFDAPHVAIVGIDRCFDVYAAIDVGCWLESVLLVATSLGVATCAQASLAVYPSVARRVLGIGDDVRIVFGIGLGYEDEEAAANRCRTSREPLESNVVFRR